jgi:hypothetical protein
MPIQLPSHVARDLGLNERDEIENVVRGVGLLDRQVGPLFSDAAKVCFNGVLSRLPIAAAVEIAESFTEIRNWRYRIVECDGVQCANVVEVPARALLSVPPPTDAEPVLVQAWFASEKLTDTDGQLRSNIVVFEWFPGISSEAKAVIRALSGARGHDGSSTTSRSWENAGLVALRTTSRLLQHGDSELLRRLFCESATEKVPRWRFLSLYRILEHGYLESVFSELSSRFFSEPREALETATKSLRSEVEQFVGLVDAHGLKPHFEEILRLNDALVAAGNRFACLVDREAKKQAYSESFKRGVALCYQIRCSIVHAGGYSVVFDKSPGGNEALIAHLPEMDKAVAQFLGVQTA